MYRKNTASQFICFQLLLTATGAVATGLSPAVRRCIDGTFAAGGGTVTEDSAGFYKYAMAQADTNGNNISLDFSAATAMPVCFNFVTTAADPTDSVRLGLTALPNAAASAIGGLPLSVDTSGRVDVLKFNGDATAAANIAKTTRAIVRATASGVPTTTSIPTSACTPAGAVADQFKGRIITFDADTASTALRGQATDITASSNAAAPVFTVTALTTAPASGDTFSIT